MEKRNPFTLIELLVILAIIGILLSILIPGIERAREASKSVVCQSNLKQFITTEFVRSQSRGGNFSQPLDTNVAVWNGEDSVPSDNSILGPKGFYKDIDSWWVTLNSKEIYVEDVWTQNEVNPLNYHFNCPSLSGRTVFDDIDRTPENFNMEFEKAAYGIGLQKLSTRLTSNLIGYGMNHYVFDSIDSLNLYGGLSIVSSRVAQKLGTTKIHDTRIAKMDNPSEKISFADSTMGSGSGNIDRYSGFRHYGFKRNTAFYDGHISFYKNYANDPLYWAKSR